MELQASLDPQINPFFSKMALVSSNPHIFASLLDTKQKIEMADCKMFCFFNFFFICTADKISFLQLSLLWQQQKYNILNSNISDLEEFWKNKYLIIRLSLTRKLNQEEPCLCNSDGEILKSVNGNSTTRSRSVRARFFLIVYNLICQKK